MAKESFDLFALDVVFIQQAIERTTQALGADGNAGDRGDPIVTIAVTHHRGLAHRTPRFPYGGDQEEPGFVDEDDVGRQPCGVFFTAGHTVRFHSAMAVSSRSTARRSGFWWLQPNWCRSLPT
jgi:hypothetical protein